MLNKLKPAKGAVKKIKRVGRGESSGHGRTSGLGNKGQHARSGRSVRPGFEGGQMPLQRRLPKRGFVSKNKIEFTILNVGRIAEYFKAGDNVTPETLYDKGVISSKRKPIKILGEGDLKAALTVKANMFSKSARTKIEAAGGKAEAL